MISIDIRFIEPPSFLLSDINPEHSIEKLKEFVGKVNKSIDVDKVSFFCGGKHLHDFSKSFNHYEIEDGDSILALNVEVILLYIS